MSAWVKIGDVDNGFGQIVHEIKCPYCKYRETYIYGKPPDRCYVCGADMRDYFDKLEDHANREDREYSL